VTLPVRTGLGSFVSDTLSIVTPWPAHIAGDLGILIVEADNLATVTNLDSSWTESTASPQVTSAGGSSSTRLHVWWRYALSSSEVPPTTTVDVSANHVAGQIVTFRGARPSTIPPTAPFDFQVGNVDNAGIAAFTIPGGTTLGADRLIALIVGGGRDTLIDQASGWTNASLTAVSEWDDNWINVGGGGGFAIATGDRVTAGVVTATTGLLATTSKQTRVALAILPDIGSRMARISFAELELPNADRRGQISFAELELPNADRRAQVSFAELELPNPDRRAQVSFAELELGDANRRAQVSFAELELGDANRAAQISFAELEIPEQTRARIAWAELQVPNELNVAGGGDYTIMLRRRRRGNIHF